MKHSAFSTQHSAISQISAYLRTDSASIIKVEFPTGMAFGDTLAALARGECCFTPRVRVETPAPPAFAREHWKGNDCRDFSVRCVLSRKHSAFSTQHSANDGLVQGAGQFRTG